MQPELAVDRAHLGRPNEPRMGHGYRMQRALQTLLPEGQEFLQTRKIWKQIVLLPHEGLQEPGVVWTTIKDMGGGEPIAVNGLEKIVSDDGTLFATVLIHAGPPARRTPVCR